MSSPEETATGHTGTPAPPAGTGEAVRVSEHIIEIVSDSGEGAQTAGQMFGTVSARMGNGVWTVEIIPAEIEPPARFRAGASGNRIRIASSPVTNMGGPADLVVAFNDQVLYSRIEVGALRPGTIILLDSGWSQNPEASVREAYAQAVEDFKTQGFVVQEVPMEQECLKHVPDARRGKNMWVVGMLCSIYARDLAEVDDLIVRKFQRKGDAVVESNRRLVQAGFEWATENLELRFEVPALEESEQLVVMNGNQAVALGAIAAGIEVCSMYPITPATSVSHYLAASIHKIGGIVHQAEDEISAIGFALGASYAGKTPITVTSGPGLALKTEFIGLAVAAELPIVIVVVQRGDPSTGLPTRVEQGDLLASLFASPGDAPKIVIAPSSIEECFHFLITARKLAEMFRGPVIVLSDATLATGQQPFPRPELRPEFLAPPLDQSPWNQDVAPYAWDPETGVSNRPVPGQRGGCYVLTGLAHDEWSRIAYDADTNQRAMEARSRKLTALRRSLKPPEIYGDPEGDLLVVSWGSTRGSIVEAIDRIRSDGGKISLVTLRFLSPLEPGLEEIFARFRKVMTVEINYSDDSGVGREWRRHAELAFLLRAQTLVDVDCWSRVPGNPLPPAQIEQALRQKLAEVAG